MKTTYAKNRQQWRLWLQKNHKTQAEIWLIYYKKHTEKPSVAYSDAVEEAICFGWIDGQIKSIDVNRYMQRYSPRTAKSMWSVINVGRARKMIKQGNMMDFGLKVFQEGMKNKKRVPSSKKFSIPVPLKKALVKNKIAWKNFGNFSPSAKLAYVYWINTAKTDETRQKRIKKTIQWLAKNKKFGDIP